ncbi:MFS transporter [Limibaculum sp. M0105]|uniref:MFS transporter n=1 Tax=Thermohalobaculum xanthum TaxID=2753746 RepID=A0A8J7M990_9RHOB|nr:MFS transporter [Thermohalobaculum xanthum]MBK0401051.1 MFS transporter [Thermohalobaculum xanthum]
MADTALARGELARGGLMAAALAFGGLPLYVHAPRYYAEEMGLGLGALGAVLLAARALDSVQDPVLGWLADRTRRYREVWALAAAALLAAGFVVLFAPPGWGDAPVRLALGLVAAFTGFSALQIALYDHGLALARAAGGGHTRVALWREAGGLVGICLAAMAPAVLGAVLGPKAGFLGFALLFVVVAAVAAGAMAGRWRASGAIESAAEGAASSFRQALETPGVGAMLAFGFVNALPTAVTSTLFLFFVGGVLQAEPHAGPMLLVFFAAAAAAAPFWARLAARTGRRRTLALGMSLSIAAFAWAYALGPGDVAPFYGVALASGAALGADMTLAPAMLAARIEGGGARVFALWTFLQKSALALAAGVALPLLALGGFEPGAVDAQGRDALSAAYALVPCFLKLAAIAMLAVLPVEKERSLATS